MVKSGINVLVLISDGLEIKHATSPSLLNSILPEPPLNIANLGNWKEQKLCIIQGEAK
jgi:hypothetical protein